jgi:hypothetical protein
MHTRKIFQNACIRNMWTFLMHAQEIAYACKIFHRYAYPQNFPYACIRKHVNFSYACTRNCLCMYIRKNLLFSYACTKYKIFPQNVCIRKTCQLSYACKIFHMHAHFLKKGLCKPSFLPFIHLFCASCVSVFFFLFRFPFLFFFVYIFIFFANLLSGVHA